MESRLFTSKTTFCTRGDKGASYVALLWEKGADTVMLTSEEMKGIKGTWGNPHIREGLEQILEIGRGETHSSLD